MATTSERIGEIDIRKVFRRKAEDLIDELKLHIRFSVVRPEQFDLVKVYKTNNICHHVEETTPESYPLRFVSCNRKEELWLSSNRDDIVSEALELMGFSVTSYKEAIAKNGVIKLKK